MMEETIPARYHILQNKPHRNSNELHLVELLTYYTFIVRFLNVATVILYLYGKLKIFLQKVQVLEIVHKST